MHRPSFPLGGASFSGSAGPQEWDFGVHDGSVEGPGCVCLVLSERTVLCTCARPDVQGGHVPTAFPGEGVGLGHLTSAPARCAVVVKMGLTHM